MSDTANALMQEELQRQLLQQQHQRQMQEIQAQHDLQMQMLQEQQRLFLEQRQRLEADHQRAEQERQKQRTAARSKATDAAPMAHLVKTYPDWRAIVGAVDISKQQPDPNNPFRKWLATKDAAYQAKINGTNSPREVEKAIALFRADRGISFEDLIPKKLVADVGFKAGTAGKDD